MPATGLGEGKLSPVPWNENIDYLAQPGGFIDSWNGSFITSNTLDAATGEHLGSSHKLLVGRTSCVRVLAFGFLYSE
ncbi:hypothetical protein EMIHUDRAFT_229875 [Emiliania huxleyi CCMP1516]|uniref:Uncharacterized protein n=2 Tax=Emiliania huxleyi TaxID=2903 RepID=A0A0D3KC36_EMIH1|nr:hypothetical protein EMIHUDRAFT_229875 [Emiliania huxleyi CCMP1516]EOD33321.1 hypothetical protein EMIHUDRAFT_229875 [Emiliania huxleyi CCMP1516]|eukprot:XP_005785750.1 hypothetical protein EMIHUDRAFT_229875 [Emiliania huxleyi CCMP1516]